MHAGRVPPDEERLVRLVRPVDEVECRVGELVVDRLHPLGRQRAGVLDPLFPHTAKHRVLGRVVRVGGPAMHDATRPEALLEFGILRDSPDSRVLLPRSGGTSCRRTHRSRGTWAGTRSCRRGDSCRTGRWHSPAVSEARRSSGPCARRPWSAPGRPTLVSPVRIGDWPVIKAARPAVQLCWPYQSVNIAPSFAKRSMLGVRYPMTPWL